MKNITNKRLTLKSLIYLQNVNFFHTNSHVHDCIFLVLCYRESVCKIQEEVANMLEKVREVMAENDRLRAEKKDYAVSTEEDNDSEELNDKVA